jgi:hypothetical protein
MRRMRIASLSRMITAVMVAATLAMLTASAVKVPPVLAQVRPVAGAGITPAMATQKLTEVFRSDAAIYDGYMALQRKFAGLPVFTRQSDAQARLTPLFAELRKFRGPDIARGIQAKAGLVLASDPAFVRDSLNFIKRSGGGDQALKALTANPALVRQFPSTGPAGARAKAMFSADAQLMKRVGQRLNEISKLQQASLYLPDLPMLFGASPAEAQVHHTFLTIDSSGQITGDPIFVWLANLVKSGVGNFQTTPTGGPSPFDVCYAAAQKKWDACLGRHKGNFFAEAACNATYVVDTGLCLLP